MKWVMVRSTLFILIYHTRTEFIFMPNKKNVRKFRGRTGSHVVVFFTLTNRVSTIPSNIRGCQSGMWSQRGTKVNGSHHGDSPLLRPTGIQITIKSMRLYKQCHQLISKRFIKPPYSISRAASIYSECCRLPTTSVPCKKADKLRSNQF